MTVQELIEQLNCLPADAKVYFVCSSSGDSFEVDYADQETIDSRSYDAGPLCEVVPGTVIVRLG